MDRTVSWTWLRGMLAAGAALTALGIAGCGSSASPAASSSAPAGNGASSSVSSSPASSSPAAGAAAGEQAVTITGTSALRFSPMTVHVHTGKVRITLKDMGAYPHNIVIPSLKVTSATVTGDPGGLQKTFTVTFPHPGRYAFKCQYHASSGMVGVFVVS
jgi:plastocyanin